MHCATSEHSRFALLPMGTMEHTKDKGWTWILAMPLAEVQKAGVDFDPNNRTVKAIQGDAASGSALEVTSIHAFFRHDLMWVLTAVAGIDPDSRSVKAFHEDAASDSAFELVYGCAMWHLCGLAQVWHPAATCVMFIPSSKHRQGSGC